MVKNSPVIADLVVDEDLINAQTVFLPYDAASPPDEKAWMHDIGSIMDICINVSSIPCSFNAILEMAMRI
jgi:hypothetical protein